MSDMPPQIPHPADTVPPTVSGDVETLRYHRLAARQIITKPRSYIEAVETVNKSRSHKLEIFQDLGQLETDVIVAIRNSLDGAEHMNDDEITKLASPGSAYIRGFSIGSPRGREAKKQRPYDALRTELGRMLGRQVIGMLEARSIAWPSHDKESSLRIAKIIQDDVNGYLLSQALQSVQGQRDTALPDDGPTLALTLRRVEGEVKFYLSPFDNELDMEELVIGVSKPILSD